MLKYKALWFALLLPLSAQAVQLYAPAGVTKRELEMMSTYAYQRYHPDYRWRSEAMEALQAGRSAEAAQKFERAARYADKAAQAMLAELYWDGRGVERDRVLAYVWMDLAAERGYKTFLAAREQYWAQLSDADRAEVESRGKPIFAEFADAVAVPRIAAQLRQARKSVTGSRVGYVGKLTVDAQMPNGEWQTMDGSEFHDDQHYELDAYLAWQNQMWNPRFGTVEVRPLEAEPLAPN